MNTRTYDSNRPQEISCGLTYKKGTPQRWGERRYYALDYYLKQNFGEKLYKISLNGGCSCPFPGIFKGALEGRAPQITEEMKLATAKAIAGLVPDEELNEDNILPEAFDPRVSQVVSEAVKALI